MRSNFSSQGEGGKFDNFYSYPEKKMKNFCSNRKWYLCSILSSPTSNTILVLDVFVVSFFSGHPTQKCNQTLHDEFPFRVCYYIRCTREVLPQRILTWPSFSLDPAVRIEMLQHHLRFEDLFQSFFVCAQLLLLLMRHHH